MTYSLIIETSTEQSGIALAHNGSLFLERRFPLGLSSSRSLMPELVEMCHEANWRVQQLSYIAVGNGPGSYTGIRVGAIVAKTLAYAISCPLVAFSSLEAFQPANQVEHYTILFDAKIAGAYVGIFQGEQPFYPQVIEMDQLESKLKEIPLIITPHAAKLRQRLPKESRLHQKKWQEGELNLKEAAKLAEERFARGETYQINTLPLLYLRQTQAEAEWQSKNS